MTNQAQNFWLNTPLPSVGLLMDRVFSYAQDGDDLSEMYLEDWKDFSVAITLFRNSDCEGLANHISEMDTSPREDLVEAFYFDCGRQFVEQNLGFEMSESWYAWQAQQAS